MGTAQDRVKFNVGGRTFETTITTLTSAESSPSFSALLGDRWNFHMPKSISKNLLYKEARFYGPEGHLRAALRGDLKGDLLQLSHEVTSPVLKEGILIRASPIGGFCIARGDTVHTYNEWNMEEHPPIRFNKSCVYDILWHDSRNIVISTSKSIGLFNSVTGVLNIDGKFTLGFVDHRVKTATTGDFKSYKNWMVDAVADETRNMICLIDEFMNVDFLDQRQLHQPLLGEVLTLSVNSAIPRDVNDSPPSIHCHEGQLFSSTRSNVCVFSGDDWVLTKVHTSDGVDSIRGISIGGDRLFSLHTDPDVVKVWETPRRLIES
ncbi:hypothetical protein CDL15_Pgr012041 [Punica granatum]|uniref:At2g24240-like C-terminal beta-propeller domain-containing protein n=1 Tax=Punica granatum TaxID=22663 RepID=A0A218XMS7_PUNGR|nr:hypothetical protein CDL15_Pgr012041 [Punica granatum]PKI77535.1 hypothetical protein CRG98_002141 [Punica granatum]